MSQENDSDERDEEREEFKRFQASQLAGWEAAREAGSCPTAKEARETLHLSVGQFCKLLGISVGTYWQWCSGADKPDASQRAFIVEAIRIARKKGFIE
jgi:DNA-binding transcriptional regulator YiaG